MKKIVFIFFVFLTACKIPSVLQIENNQTIPKSYNQLSDTVNTAQLNFRVFFSDPYLVALIDTAINNNFEALSSLQDIQIAKNYIKFKNGFLFPIVNGSVGLGLEKTGRYTAQGAGNASTEITPGKEVPEPIGDIFLGFRSAWELDIWGKLHNAKKAAVIRYLKSVEGRNFILTNLVAEISNSYYELLSLDNQYKIIQQAIEVQKNQLEILKIQKQAAMANELAVKQFEAQVYNSQSQEFDILQRITETENKINFLLARYPRPINRNSENFNTNVLNKIKIGIPSQLLQNRPDIKQAELELSASKLDVKIARAEFYPTVGINGVLGLQGFKPKYVTPTLENLAFSFVGDLVAPLINKNAIEAEFKNASSQQIIALYDYQQSILKGYIEVYNEMSNIKNLEKYYELKSKQSQTLYQSIDIAKDLFKSDRANYLEVLTVQRDALAAQLELIDARKSQFVALTNIYKSLGGGWR